MRAQDRRGGSLSPFVVLLVGVLVCARSAAWGQSSSPPPPPPPDEPQVADSGVGYIDPAFLATVFRLRYDSAYNLTGANRAEFYWPIGPPFGPGPNRETSTDYQDFTAYLEYRATTLVSVFGEVPFRLLDPTLNDNTGGPGDINVGSKLALWTDEDSWWTAQLRVYAPTGDASRGLGTRHATIEPGLLIFQRLSSHWTLEAELRDWIAVGGTDGVAGNILRYGVGTSYLFADTSGGQTRGVLEAVGWTVLDGARGAGPPPIVVDAVGDTIVNLKLGVRHRFRAPADVYIGYGRVLTRETWYEDVFRAELRWFF